MDSRRTLLEKSGARAEKLLALPTGSTVHLSGICGTGMAAVASLLAEKGYQVQGSDRAFYAPMGPYVKNIAQRVFEGYQESNLNPSPDFVVIGNSIRPDNPESLYVQRLNLPFASMPEVFQALLIGSRNECSTSIVATGTHGKTTTSALLAHTFETAGRKPGFFIGGIPENFSTNIRPVSSDLPPTERVVILEGDEYDSAWFAKWPKFLSYRPDIAIVTSVEFDHADIYNSLEEIDSEFNALAELVPAHGSILVSSDNEHGHNLGLQWKSDAKIKATVYFYGEHPDSTFRLLSRKPWDGGGGQDLVFNLLESEVRIRTTLSGQHNAQNILATLSAGHLAGLSISSMQQAISTFKGVKRRQFVHLNTPALTIVEDFAHHPTAVNLTLRGLREAYPDKELFVIFEPRSNTSRRDFFQHEYTLAFDVADQVFILEVADAGGYAKTSSPTRPLDTQLLAQEISIRGPRAFSLRTMDEIFEQIVAYPHKNSLVVIMSNGDLGNLIERLVSSFSDEV